MKKLLFLLLLLPTLAFGATDFPAGSGNWTVGATWNSGSVPTSATDVLLNNSYDVQCNTTNCTCKSLDMTGGTGWLNFTGTSKILTVAGNITLAAGKFFGGTDYTNNINISDNCTFVDGGNNLPSIDFRRTGATLTLGSNIIMNYTNNRIAIFNGTLDTNNYTLTTDRIFASGSVARGLTFRNSTIYLKGASVMDLNTTTNLVLDAGTSTIIINGSGNVFFNSGGSANMFYNITRLGTAAKTDGLVLPANLNLNGTLNLSGNSVSNRILVYSDTLGTGRTINVTGATVTATNADFRDIIFRNTTEPVNLSASSGGIGDCGGNYNVTFTPSANWYWHVDSGSWSNSSKWFNATNGGGSVATHPPLPQDDVYIDSNSIDSASQTITQDMPRMCRSFDATGSKAFTLDIGVADQSIYGSFVLETNTTLPASGGDQTYFDGRSSFNLDTKNRTITFSSDEAYVIRAVGGTYTLLSDLHSGDGNNYFVFSNGIFKGNDFNLTTGYLFVTGTSTRSVILGNGTYSLGRPTAVFDATVSTGLTFAANSSLIKVGNIGFTGTTRNFVGGGLTFNNLTVTNNNISVYNSSTFNNFTLNGGTRAWFASNTTNTFTTFLGNGSAGNYILLNSSVANFAANFSNLGTITAHYTNISNINITAGSAGDATDNCANVTGVNANWTFTAGGAAPAPRSQVITVSSW